MTEKWNDFLLRASLGETGAIPRNFYWESPDIIPAGSQPVQHATQTYANPQSYAQDVSQNIDYDYHNFIYVRAKNLKDGANQGTVHLYWSINTLLNYPYVWEINEIGTPVSLSAKDQGELCCNPGPIVWETVPPLSDSEHYCLIAWVQTDQHPDMPNADSVQTLAEYIATNGNWSQRNVSLIQPTLAHFKERTYWPGSKQSAEIVFEVSWSNARPNDQIELFAQKPLTDGTTIDSGRLVIDKADDKFLIKRYVESEYKSEIDVYYWAAAGQTLPPGLEIRINVHLLNDQDDQILSALGTDLVTAGLANLPALVPGGGFRPLAQLVSADRTTILCGTQVIRVGQPAGRPPIR